ncbi:hypothetical protein K458DRAFT_18001 [Lentithecium fluviatile CBS 122367]|uniref:Zn(2)-C6 fungal-type domain-containing protein n=1 Tax=Lentithecium fluviatile CBS 122367 TaxID=1168545 RepID=A0A6G1J6F2_9PLEO|nr:hypothetical protein K458DRAFT_18001 [Lentithecium fluviatile CBS 122367]
MASSNEHRRITKRSSNACSRCRRQKIKCSGLQPCANCSKRSLTCIFDDRDQKVLVTQGYLADLQEKVARLERRQSIVDSDAHEPPHQNLQSDIRYARPQQITTSSPGDTRASSLRGEPSNTDNTELTNPLLESPSKFMSSSSGRAFYLGTSSNWSFHGQVLGLVHLHVRKTPLPGAELLFDGAAYDLPWDGSRSVSDASTPIIPSIDYAIFLINAVKFHCSQLMHLFDEDEFMLNLHAFYSDTENGSWKGTLWYTQFLLIIAFGKTFVQQKQRSSKPPGIDFFVRALQLLPDTTRLCREPVLGSEILCCIALYLQALDARNAAHVTIGQAMRIALAQGMHTDMPIADLGEAVVQRCRKIWWTIFILDRQMTALMGLPQSIRDEDISCQLPNFAGSAQRTAGLTMQIKLARIYAEIARTVYGSKGRLRKKFVLSIKAVLDNLTALAEELRQSFPLHTDGRFGGISRMPAHLHLLYYQTIVVTTRPLLFCCLKKVFESLQEVERLVASRKIRQLLYMSVEASQKILNILDSLQDQGLLETFLPWDLDSLFVSTMVLLLARFVDRRLLDTQFPWLDKAFNFLDTIINSGNRIADFRLRELRKLEEMLNEYSALRAQLPHTPTGIQIDPSLVPSQDPVQAYTGISDEGSGFGEDLTAEQILTVADSMELEGTDWVSFAMMEQYQVVDPHNACDLT